MGGGARLWKGLREEAREAGKNPRTLLWVLERSLVLVAAMCCLNPDEEVPPVLHLLSRGLSSRSLKKGTSEQTVYEEEPSSGNALWRNSLQIVYRVMKDSNSVCVCTVFVTHVHVGDSITMEMFECVTPWPAGGIPSLLKSKG